MTAHLTMAVAFAAVALAACDRDSAERRAAPRAPVPSPSLSAAAPVATPRQPPAPTAAAPAAPATTPAVAPSSGSTVRALGAAELAGDLAIDGTFVAAHAWQDRNGENVALFSSKETKPGERRLRVVHAAGPKGNRRQLRRVDDGEICEEGDLTADFVPQAFGVSDLDGDGISEVTFAYRLACRTDVSPSRLKLIVLEGGDKYILRGSSRISEDPDPTSSFTPEPASASWPAGVLAHAETSWERIATEF